MFLKDSETNDLVEVVDLKEVVDPTSEQVTVRYQAGEEEGDPVKVNKTKLAFPSGEGLPKCWLDPHYRVSF